MKNAVVFVIGDYSIDDTVFCKVAYVCYEGRTHRFVRANSLIKYEFFPEDEEV